MTTRRIQFAPELSPLPPIALNPTPPLLMSQSPKSRLPTRGRLLRSPSCFRIIIPGRKSVTSPEKTAVTGVRRGPVYSGGHSNTRLYRNAVTGNGHRKAPIRSRLTAGTNKGRSGDGMGYITNGGDCIPAYTGKAVPPLALAP